MVHPAPRLALLLLVAATGLIGCGEDAAKGAEASAPLDGKLDSFRSPKDHGELTLGGRRVATLGPDQQFHAWTFSLSGPADVLVYTERDSSTSPRALDTVLYLYRQGEDGSWGRYIARNDDAGETGSWSSLTVQLDAGRYRVLVKGYAGDEQGAFAVGAECDGAGCGPVPDFSCDSLAEWLADEGCPDTAEWGACFALTPWGDVSAAASACCGGDPERPSHVWCN